MERQHRPLAGKIRRTVRGVGGMDKRVFAADYAAVDGRSSG